MRNFSSDSVLKLENVLDTSFKWDILAWRNQPDVRRYMIDDTEISEESHRAYLESLKHSDRRRVFVLTDLGEPLIVVNVVVDDDEGAFFTGWYGVDGSSSSPYYALYASFVVRDSLLSMHPDYEFRSQVLLENEKSWRFLSKLGYSISEPYSMTLKSGREADVVDVRCDRDMWLSGSENMRMLYERVLREAKFAQRSIARQTSRSASNEKEEI